MAVNSLAATSVKRADGDALEADDIESGQLVRLVYDGTAFRSNVLEAPAGVSLSLSGTVLTVVQADGTSFQLRVTEITGERVSFFDGGVVGGSPDADGATPGVVWGHSGPSAAKERDGAQLVDGSNGTYRASQQVPPSYVENDAVAYITTLNWVRQDDLILLRLRTTNDDSGGESGPQLTDDAETNWGLAIKVSDGSEYKWAISDLISTDTTEPYEWDTFISEALVDAILAGTTQAIIVDRSHANVDWANLMVNSTA